MKTIMILAGHGNYASGLRSTLEMLAGRNEDIYSFDFTENETDVTLKEKMIRILNEHHMSQVLFICDLLGGTPFKVSAELANTRSNMEVVAGCNVAAILEALFQKDELSIQQLADFIVNATKQAVSRFQKVTGKEISIQDHEEEGI